MKIAIAGTGYVGLSNAMLLAQHNEVVAVDIDATKIAKLNQKISPIADVEIEDFLANKSLNFTATLISSKLIKVPTMSSYLPLPITTLLLTILIPHRLNRLLTT
jgi:UDP-glucose 6-dehydrogenase